MEIFYVALIIFLSVYIVFLKLKNKDLEDSNFNSLVEQSRLTNDNRILEDKNQDLSFRSVQMHRTIKNVERELGVSICKFLDDKKLK